MKVELTIDKFDITELGLYKKGETNPFLYNIEELFSEINEKFTNIDLINTKTFSKTRYKNQSPVYLLNITKDNDYVFFSTWNELDVESNKIQALKGSKKYGDKIEVSSSNFDIDDILGVPAFFIIDKKHQKIFTIRQKGIMFSGTRGLSAYIENYMAYFSDYIFFEPESLEKIIIGHKQNEKIFKLYPRLKFRLSTKTTDHDLLLNNYAKIIRIIKKEKFDINTSYKGEGTFKFLNIFSSSSNFSKSETNIRIELSVKPSKEEVKELIDEYFNSGDNCGFVFSNPDKIIWLDEIRLSKELTCELKLQDNGLFDFVDLLKNVKPHLNF